MIFVAFCRGRPNVGRGLIISAAVTFALSAACWAIVNPEELNDMLHGRSPRIL